MTENDLERLERIEAALRLHRRIAVGLLVIVVGVLVTAAVRPQNPGTTPATLRLQRLELGLEGEEKPQITLSASPDGGKIFVKSADGKAQIAITAAIEHNGLPSAGSIDLISAEGITAIGHASIYGELGSHHAWYLAEDAGVPFLALYDKNGRKKCQLSASESGGMVLESEKGGPLELARGAK